MAITMQALDREYQQHGEVIVSAIMKVLEHQKFILGPEVKEFEAHLSEYLSRGLPEQHLAVGVGNGTDALVLALKAADLPKDSVIAVPAFTFFATYEAVVLAGHQPVLIDIHPRTWNLNPYALKSWLGNFNDDPRPAAAIFVHLFGSSDGVLQTKQVCDENGMVLIEDCAQALGTICADNRLAGTVGEVSAFSFFPSKNLGCYGDGGAILSRYVFMAERARQLRAHGSKVKYEHLSIGTNSRLDTLQAAVLLAKLPFLDQHIARRQEIAAMYDAALRPLGLVRNQDPGSSVNLYSVLLPDLGALTRDSFREFLGRKGIETAVHYPTALNRQPALLDDPNSLIEMPVADLVAKRIVSLPCHAYLTNDEVDTVIDAVKVFLS